MSARRPAATPVAAALAAAAGVGLAVFSLAFALAFAFAFASGSPAWAQASSASSGTSASAARDARMVATYRDLLRQEPDQAYALRRLLEVSHAVGGLPGLISLYKTETRQHPERFSAWLILGHLHAASDGFEGAAEAYARAAALEPRSPSPSLGEARLYGRQRRWGAAFKAFDAATEKLVSMGRAGRDRAQQVLREAAEIAAEAKDFERLGRYFDRLIQTDPKNVFLPMQYAAMLARVGRREDALAQWRQLHKRPRVRLDERLVIWRETATLLSAMGRDQEAEAVWRRGLAKLPRGHWERRTFLDGLIAAHRRGDRLRQLVADLSPKMAKDYALLLAVARVHEELAEDAKALALYQRAASLRPREDEARLARLRLIERLGTPAQVVAAYKALVAATPGEARHVLKLAELHFQYGDKAAGYALMGRISKRFRRDPGVHQRLVDLWMRYGDRADRQPGNPIEAEYTILLRLEPRQQSHVVSFGEYYWSIDQRDRALKIWRRLLKMGRDRAHGHLLLADVYADHALYADAEEHYEEAMVLAPDDPRIATRYALMLEGRGRRQDALSQWQRVLELQGAAGPPGAGGGRGGGRRRGIAEARRHVIGLWERGGRLKYEVDALETRFGATPPDLQAGRFLAAAYLRLRRVADAGRVLERLVSLMPEDIEALQGLESVYSGSGDLPGAIDVLGRLARADTARAADYLRQAADHALLLNDPALALQLARRVVALDPASATAHLWVGELFVGMEHRAEAAAAWRQALLLDPTMDSVRLKLADLYREMGNSAREEQVLADVLRGGRGQAAALRAGRRLLQLAVNTGRLDAAEEALEALAKARGQRALFLQLLVEVYAYQVMALRYSRGPLDAANRDAALAALGSRALKPLLEALNDGDITLGARAMEVLAATRPPAAAPALARIIEQGDTLSTVQAAIVLGQMGSVPAVRALARLLQSKKRSPRLLAIWSLGLAEGSESLPELLAARAKSGSSAERRLIAVALGRAMSGAKASDKAALLAERLATTQASAVRIAGIWATAWIAAPRSVPVLSERLKHALFSARSGRWAAELGLVAWGLGRVGTARAQRALVGGVLVAPPGADAPLWRALAHGPRLRDEAGSRRAQMLRAYDGLLNRSRGSVAAPRDGMFAATFPPDGSAAPADAAVVVRFADDLEAGLAELLRRPNEGDVARLCAMLLRVDTSQGVSFVAPGVLPQAAAANAAASLRLIAPHAQLLRDTARGGRRASGLALGVLVRMALREPAATPPGSLLPLIEGLLGAAQGGGSRPLSQGIQAAALVALAELSGALPTDDEPLKHRLAEVLRGLAAASILRTPAVRAEWAKALAYPELPSTQALLLALLDDPLASVRAEAARSLGRGRSAASVGPLWRAAWDASDHVAAPAIAALGRLHGRGIVGADEALQAVAASANPRRGRLAQAALGDGRRPEP